MRKKTEINRDFRLIDATAERALAMAVVSTSRASHFIVRSEAAGSAATAYWVIDRATALALLGDFGPRLVGAALRLQQRDPALMVAAGVTLASAERDQVVLADERAIGFIPASETDRGGRTRSAGMAFEATEAPLVDRGRPAHAARAGDPVPATLTRELSGAWLDAVEAGSVTVLLVSLASLGDSATGSGPLQLAPGSTIDIVVLAVSGVTLVGENKGTLVVSDPQPDAPLMFQLKAGAAGRGAVRVYAFSGGRSLAALNIATTIVPAGLAPDTAMEGRVTATVPASARTPPDLSLIVIESDGAIHYRLRRNAAGAGDQEYRPVRVPNGSRDFFAQFARDVEGLAIDSADQRNLARGLMERRGVDLFQRLLPQELKTTLWEQRSRVGTVQITSDDAWIPWEVCRLTSQDSDGRNVEGAHFAEAFAVTRWLHGTAAPERFRFGRWALVVPESSELPLAAQEKAYIQGLGRADRAVCSVPARFADVTAALESERFQAWHFCGHGNAGTRTDGDKAEIELDARERLPADAFTGRLENALRTGPFIFLNACQSAQGGPSLTGVGGWAHRFIRPSLDRFAAAAFVGSYWSVYDTAAHGFAKGVYDRLLLRGLSIGQAVREARLEVRTPDDPLTWLAYTVYADPLAKADRSAHDPAAQ